MDLEEQLRAGLSKMMQGIVLGMGRFVAVVKEVDETSMTCVLESLSGSEYHSVRLKPSPNNATDGVIAIPVIGSHVIADRLSNKNDLFVLMVDKVKKYVIKCSDGGEIELNGNSYSMARPDKIAERIKRVEDALSAFQAIYNTHTHPVSGAVAGVTPMLSNQSVSPVTKASDISHDKVKHG